MSVKHIRMFTDDIGPVEKCGWSDTWVQCYIGKRKKLKLGPCYESSKNVQQLLDCEKEYIQKELAKSTPSKRYVEYLNEQLDYYQSVLDGIKDKQFYCDDRNKLLPSIYIRGDYITRKSIEEATTWYLTKIGVVHGPVRYQWEKWKCYITTIL